MRLQPAVPSIFFRTSFLLILLIACGASRGALPRLALIDDSKDPSIDSAIALVEAKLSSANDVSIVDRKAIDQVLGEQTLAKSGVAGAGYAVATGKLLSADLLALLTPLENGASLVVFDANTGMRLTDIATTSSGATLVDECTVNITAAVQKRARSEGAAGSVRSVCLLTVRNADLPNTADGVVRAAGEILIRRLTSAPEIAVVERERLGHVNSERELTGVQSALIASTISIELQIARDPGSEGVAVTAVLAPPSGQRTALPAVHVARIDPDEIARSVLPPLLTALHAAPIGPSSDSERIAESAQFQRECLLLWSHGQSDGTLPLAEAAYALNSNDFHAAILRARATLLAGISLVCSEPTIDPAQRVEFFIKLGNPGVQDEPRIPAADMLLALQFIQRAEDQLEAAEFGPGQKALAHAAADPKAAVGPTPLDSYPIALNTQEFMRSFFAHMQQEMASKNLHGPQVPPLTLNADQAAIYAAIQKAYRHRRLDLERANAPPPSTADFNSVMNYRDFVNSLLMDALFVWSPNGQTWTEDWTSIVHDWVGIAAPLNAAAREQRQAASGAPVTSSPPATQPLIPRRLGAATRPTTRPRFHPPLMVRSSGPMPTMLSVVNPQKSSLIQCDGVPVDLMTGMTNVDWQRLSDLYDQLTPLHTSESATLVDAAHRLVHSQLNPHENDVVSNRPVNAPPPPVFHLRAPTELHGTDAAATPEVGPGTSWPDSRLLAGDATEKQTRDGQADRVVCPLVDPATRTVYALSSIEGEEAQLRLISYDPDSGVHHIVSSLGSPSTETVSAIQYGVLNGESATLSDGYYVYLSPIGGALLFPLAGGSGHDLSVRSLLQGNPQSATVLDGNLYLAIGRGGHEGRMVEYNLKTRAVRTIAASRRVAAEPAQAAGGSNTVASPFDDQPPLFVWSMHADPEQHRIVFLASNPSWPAGLSGWWEYVPATAKYRQLSQYQPRTIAEAGRRAVWAEMNHDRKITFGGPATQPSELDLKTDTIAPLAEVPRANDYRGPGSGGSSGDAAMETPLYDTGDWIWGRFARYQAPADDIASSAKPGRRDFKQGTHLQSFDPVRPVAFQWGDWPTYLQPIDGDHLIVGDGERLWSLHVPSGDTAAMARLVRPARPVNAPVEPIGDPPTGPGLPWKSVQIVYDSARDLNTGPDAPLYMHSPQVAGDTAYAFACGFSSSSKSSVGQLFTYSLTSGERKELGQVTLQNFRYRAPSNRVEQICGWSFKNSAVDEKNYYISDGSQLIYAMPLDGGKGQIIHPQKDGFARIDDFTAVNGTLYLSLSTATRTSAADGSTSTILARKLTTYDTGNGAIQELTLPDQPPATGPNVHDAPLSIRLMKWDQRRQRLLFFLNHQPKADPSVDGLWSYTPGGTPTRVSPLDLWSTGQRMGETVFDSCGPIDGDEWLLYSINGAIRLNVDTLRFDRLWQIEPANQAPLGANVALASPIAVVGDWMWDGLLHRAKLDGSELQQLPLMRVMDQRNTTMPMRLIQSIHDWRDVVLADHCGMWVLH